MAIRLFIDERAPPARIGLLNQPQGGLPARVAYPDHATSWPKIRHRIFRSLAACACASSTRCQLVSGSNCFRALATTAVSLPRSFSYTLPSAPTTKVITPEDRYSAGCATTAKPSVILPL